MKNCIIEASRVAEQRETSQNLKIWWGLSLLPSIPSMNKCLKLQVNNYAKTDTNVFWSCSILLHFFYYFRYTLQKIAWRINYFLIFFPSLLHTFLFLSFSQLKILLKCLIQIRRKKLRKTFEFNYFPWALVGMLGFGQQLRLESFQLWLMVVFGRFSCF